ncbi:MAG: DEAD/DEAH box helicase [Candidatus Micrarchaeota archaeon]
METEFRLEEVLMRLSYEKLNPMQGKAIAEGFLESRKSLVCAPTASGKTLLATLSIIKNFQETKRKAFYIVPLKALAQEKYAEFSELLSQYDIKVALSTSDFDSSAEELFTADVIIATIEKLDSLLRHKISWLERVNLAVIDEAHLLNDDSRGATLEIVMVKLLNLNLKLVALSATIPNSDELAKWLNAQLFQSDYRPTKLVYGVAADSKISFYEKPHSGLLASPKTIASHKIEKLHSKNPLGEIVKKCVDGKGQALVFVSARRAAEAAAKELGMEIYPLLSQEEKTKLEELSNKALKTFPSPTMQCTALATCIKNGVAFHHAGIPSKQRGIIEQGFKKDRCIKAIAATTTLAMGIDYPASCVVIRDLKRFTGAFSEFLPNFEISQMAGRAGRPKYDKEGLAVLMCSPKDREYVLDNYVYGSTEKIYSKLANAAFLRMHCLGLIASGHCDSFKSLYDFFGRSLFAHQYGKTEELFEMIENVVFELREMEFITERKSTSLIATPLGKRVSELYIDPLSANEFVNFIKLREPKTPLDFLFAINSATEMRPLLSVKRTEEMALFAEAENLELGRYLESHYDDRDFLEKYKSALLLEGWVSEMTEEQMLEKFGMPPGILAGRVRNSQWLSYSIAELAFMLNETEVYRGGKRMTRRIKHGIREELLDICRVKGIGRARGRRLFNAGIKTAEELSKRSKEEIRAIIKVEINVGAASGEKTASA